MRAERVSHEFVEFIPKELSQGTLYISIPYATVVHLCLCGCGERVVTPISPTDWRLIFDGETVSLDPSVGNWSFDCQSHYVIKRSRVIWAAPWSPAKIEAGRARDRRAKEQYFGEARSREKDRETPDGAASRPNWLRRQLARLLR
jgi:Family of unknown function (DUF6527)